MFLNFTKNGFWYPQRQLYNFSNYILRFGKVNLDKFSAQREAVLGKKNRRGILETQKMRENKRLSENLTQEGSRRFRGVVSHVNRGQEESGRRYTGPGVGKVSMAEYFGDWLARPANKAACALQAPRTAITGAASLTDVALSWCVCFSRIVQVSPHVPVRLDQTVFNSC